MKRKHTNLFFPLAIIQKNTMLLGYKLLKNHTTLRSSDLERFISLLKSRIFYGAIGFSTCFSLFHKMHIFSKNKIFFQYKRRSNTYRNRNSHMFYYLLIKHLFIRYLAIRIYFIHILGVYCIPIILFLPFLLFTQ